MDDPRLRFGRIQFNKERKPTPPIRLDSIDVHVWGFILDIEESELIHASSLLSDDERARSDRLLSEQHRRRLIAAHAGLRMLLSRYCRQSPQHLVIQKASAGKPFLRDFSSIRFNLTHSHGRALVAVGNDREVGIDLEKVRPEVDVLGLAKRFLSGQDQAFIESGELESRHERFLQAWVAREAVFKAEGTGITFPLHHDHIELRGDGTEGCVILGAGMLKGAVRPVRFLALEPGWIGAVVAEGTNWMVSYRE